MSEGGTASGTPELGGLPLSGHWLICDELIRAAEEVGPELFSQDPLGQAELIWRLGNPEGGYWHLPIAHRTEVLSRLIPLVPRVNVAEPLVALERLFRLWHGPNPREAISRAVRVNTYEPRPLASGEEIYQVGGFCEEFVDWTRESSAPASFLFGGALIALAGVCGFNLFIDRGVDILRLGTHYTIFTGRKGTGKSVSLDAAKDLLHRVNHLIYPWVPGNDLPDTTKPNPLAVRFMPEDTNWRTIVGCLKSTPTMLQSGVVDQETLKRKDIQMLLRQWKGQWFPPDEGVLLLDEAATIFGKQNFAVDRIVPGLNTLHGGRPYVYQTQSGGLIRLDRPSIVFAGCCPPDILQSALTETLFKGGFLDRVNVVHHEALTGPTHYSTARPRDPVVAVGLAKLLLHVRQLALVPFQMVARPDAERFFDEWHHAQREPEDQRELSISRRGNHLWRYAAYIALGNDRQPYISLKDFECAARIQEYELACYRQLLVALETDPAAELLDYIERQLYRHDAIAPEGWMARSALFRLLRERKGLSPPTLKALPYLESLEQSGRIHQRVNGAHRYFQLTVEAASDLAARAGSKTTPT